MSFFIRISITLCLFFTVLLSPVGAQEPKLPAYELGLSLHPGFLMAHQQSMLPMQAHTMGVELQFTRRVFAPSSWSDAYRLPGIGVNALYMNLGNPEVNGQVFAILPTFETGLGSNRKAHWTFRAATGIGWVTRRFDIHTNRSNLAMSSYLNGAMQLSLNYHRQFKDDLLMKTGLIVTHFSNASARVPNLGINMPALYIGFSGLFSEKTRSEMKAEKEILRLPWLFYGSWATKQLNTGNPQHFNVFSFGGRKVMPTGKENRFFRLGADAFLDKTYAYVLDSDRPLNSLRIDEMTEFGLVAGYQMGISRVDFFGDIGVYAYRPGKFKAPFYQRIGFNLHLNEHLLVHLALKTHYATADIFEWGFGYQIQSAKR